ncbi:hypothetical protein OPIT5_27275 [Opitutaceae bacterium TAV5]|nr:hypothetical protein OPIT5_27275 [Opitutaceae bacterium TAV5]
MKLKKVILLAAALGLAVSLNAADKVIAGPKGGRLLETSPQKAEFFVNADRKVEITFYDAALKPVAPAAQVVAVTAELKSGRIALELEKTAAGFVSKEPLPQGEPYRVVVQVRETPEASPKNFRVRFDLHTCGGCDRPEYACTCGH